MCVFLWGGAQADRPHVQAALTLGERGQPAQPVPVENAISRTRPPTGKRAGWAAGDPSAPLRLGVAVVASTGAGAGTQHKQATFQSTIQERSSEFRTTFRGLDARKFINIEMLM